MSALTAAVGHDLVLLRHGQTAWNLSGQYTGTTDIPLTPQGEAQARSLAPVLARWDFAAAWSSPRLRARRTAQLAGVRDARSAMTWSSGTTGTTGTTGPTRAGARSTSRPSALPPADPRGSCGATACLPG
ncbi:histidine phosphatase family protein [Kineococcus sp. R86509]|uniref:histidine phosphatase family protein n=1 Tax=unclassified Kineococcus TaxID=2621656 RepID=UPI0036D3AF2A